MNKIYTIYIFAQFYFIIELAIFWAIYKKQQISYFIQLMSSIIYNIIQINNYLKKQKQKFKMNPNKGTTRCQVELYHMR